MEGSRDESGRIYGPPQITLVPQQEPGANSLPTLHTSRTTKEANFQVLKQPETWYPASRDNHGEAALSWDLRRQHKRWLRGNRPDAAVAGLSDLLADLMTDLDGSPTERPATRPLLAISLMPDSSDPKRVINKPLLATAAGSSGESVRLTALTRFNWRWDGHTDPILQLLQADDGDKQEIALWSIDGSPVTQIKAALDLTKREAGRFIIVQKRSSTTVLKPRYQRVPVPVKSFRPGADEETTSRIDPLPITTIQSWQTGGNAHSDVAFKPSSDEDWEQLAIIDDRGYWTVWSIEGRGMVGRYERQTTLQYCGHIQLGMLETPPQHPDILMSPEHHGILWIGLPVADPNCWVIPLKPEDIDFANPTQLLHGSASNHRLLVWSRSHLVVINLHNGSHRDVAHEMLGSQYDEILAVEISPANQSHAFILTTSSVLWVNFQAEEASSNRPSGLSIILCCAHLRPAGDREHLKMTVLNGWTELGADSSVIALHSEDNPNLTIFAFGTVEDTNLPRFHHQTLTVQSPKAAEERSPSGLHSVCLAPTPLISSNPTGPGAGYMRQGIRFWQLFVLRTDLSVACAVTAAGLTGLGSLAPPGICQRTRKGWKSEYHQRRSKMIRGLADTFVVPDAFGDLEELARLKPAKDGEESPPDPARNEPQRWPRAPVEGIDLLISRVAISMESIAQETQHVKASEESTAVFDPVRRTAFDCLDRPGNFMSLRTFRDFGATFEAPPLDAQSAQAWDDQLQSLLSVGEARLAIDAVTPTFLDLDILNRPSLENLRRRLERSWPTDNIPQVARLSRELALAEAAEAALRSMYGIAAFDAETSEAFDGLSSWVPEPRMSVVEHRESTQHRPYPSPRLTQSLSPGPSSRSTSRATSVAMSRSSSQEFSVPGSIQRLSMLAGSINVARKPPGQEHVVLSYWPEERGVSTQGYVSSIQTTSSKKTEEAQRGRRQKAESQRRAKRNRIMRPGVGNEAASAPGSELPPSSQFVPVPASSQALPPIISGPHPKPAYKTPGLGRNNMASFSTQAQPTDMSSQLPSLIPEASGGAMASSQVVSSSQTQGLPQIMSQPVAGQHGKRIVPQQQKKKKEKKPKRKGGF